MSSVFYFLVSNNIWFGIYVWSVFIMNKTQEALRMVIEVMTERGWYADKRCSDLIQTCKEALAELALQKMADNAKELGLDYCKHGSDSACKECYMEQVVIAQLSQNSTGFINPEGYKYDYDTGKKK